MLAAKRLFTLLLAAGTAMGGSELPAAAGGADVARSGAAVAGELEEKMVDLIVRLRDDWAAAVQGGAGGDSTAAVELDAALGSFGVALRPLHPGISDPELATYFIISGLPLAQAERLMNRLHSLGGVEAAYIQPPASPA